MEKLDAQIRVCTLCGLAQGRTNAVPGSGPVENVELVMVGEAPGRNEDIAGKPFVGSGGKLLDSFISNAGLSRNSIYITNIVKCRPPDNRKPLGGEVEICTTNYLEKQLEILKPLLICTLGATALEYFTGKSRMGEFRGKLIKTKNGVPLFPTYHPAAVFRNQSYRAILQSDVKRIPEILRDLKKKTKGRQMLLSGFQ